MEPIDPVFCSDLLRLSSEIEPLERELCLLESIWHAKDKVASLSELINEYPKTLKALEYLFMLNGEVIQVSCNHTLEEKADYLARRAEETGIIKLLCTRNLRDYLAGFHAGTGKKLFDPSRE